MRVLELNTGLFPDRETVQAAVREIEADHDVRRIDLTDAGTDPAAWDAALAEILIADRVVTI